MIFDDSAKRVRFASGINILLGGWLIVSPFIYGYADLGSTPGFLACAIIGALIMVLGALRCIRPHSGVLLSWANAALGAWTIISPWVFGYSDDMPRLWTSVLIGAAVGGFAIRSGTLTVAEHQHRNT